MLLRIDQDKPDRHRISKVINCLREGGIIIYPTDTIYTLGCDLYNKEGYKKLCHFKEVNPKNANFSIVCHNLSQLSEYCMSIPTSVYRILNRSLPGPYTFILPARKNVEKIFGHKRATIGIRVPDNAISQAIVEGLGNPIISTSIKHPDEILEYFSDPREIYYEFKDDIDILVHGGMGGLEPSTIVDLSGDEPVVVRQGKGMDALRF